jgi:hypothetical protein
MGRDGVAQAFELAVDTVLAKRMLKSSGVKEDVDVFGKPLDQVPSFGQTGSPFENGLVLVKAGDDTKGFGDVIVFFNDGSSESSGLKVIGGAQDGLFEISVLSQSHSAVFPSLPGARVRKRREHPKIEFGKWIQRGPQLPQDFWFLPDLFAEGAKQGANSWRLMPRDFQETFEGSRL